jgi:hypothetical protein
LALTVALVVASTAVWSTKGVEFVVSSDPVAPLPAAANVDLDNCERVGDFDVCGMIRERYLGLGGSTGVLGLPTSEEFTVAAGSGRGSHFQGGDVYWSAPTGAYEVVNPALDVWRAAGGAEGTLGFPLSGLSPAGAGQAVRFEHGTIASSQATGTHVVPAPVDTTWWDNGGPGGVLGLPLLDQRPAVGAEAVTFFQGGTVYVVGDQAGDGDEDVDATVVRLDGQDTSPAVDVPTVFGLGLADFIVVRTDRAADPPALSPLVWTSDGCSGPTPPSVDTLFQDACFRHDFGYRNFLTGPLVDPSRQRRLAVDDQFLADARDTCAAAGQPLVQWQLGVKVKCLTAARLMYDALRLFGRPS